MISGGKYFRAARRKACRSAGVPPWRGFGLSGWVGGAWQRLAKSGGLGLIRGEDRGSSWSLGVCNGDRLAKPADVHQLVMSTRFAQQYC